MPGQYTYNREFSGVFRDLSTQITVLAAADPDATAITGRAKHQIVVRKIVINVTTTAAATITFQSSNGTPVVFAALITNAPIGNHVWDFGEHGWEIAPGENLVIVGSAAGVGGGIIIDAHEIPERDAAMLPSQV